jgi:hypothetical protein
VRQASAPRDAVVPQDERRESRRAGRGTRGHLERDDHG